MDAEAAPQAARLPGIDWDELAKLAGPEALALIRESFQKWDVGQEGDWLWAVCKGPKRSRPLHSPLRTVIVAITPMAMAEQLTVQEHLIAVPEDGYALQDRLA